MTSLTPRQQEIAGLLAEGLRPKQIAQRLGIAQSTVHAHLANAALRIGRRGPRMLVVALFHDKHLHTDN